jgi:hypothetical protein
MGEVVLPESLLLLTLLYAKEPESGRPSICQLMFAATLAQNTKALERDPES